jgi:hypothetical protein
MFRQYTRDDKGFLNTTRATNLLQLHPQELSDIVEWVWYWRQVPPPSEAPFPANPLIYDYADEGSRTFRHKPKLNSTAPAPAPQSIDIAPFEHLIYAYMVENTRIYDIFRRVVSEFTQGEKLGNPSKESQRWLRATEELFFREPPSFLSFSLTSQLRPDLNAVRRNAYYRMFGLDLNHGTDDNKPYPYAKPAAANRDFIPTLEALLIEVWKGIMNYNNTSGSSEIDDAAIASQALRLRNMLTTRRLSGNLAREEFWSTAMMSWFHLTVEFDSPIVVDLQAKATSPEERLRKIGERVGLPCHGKSESFLILSTNLSLFLRQFESGAYTDPTSARLLYLPVGAKDFMVQVITHYSLATGRDIKARSVALKKL